MSQLGPGLLKAFFEGQVSAEGIAFAGKGILREGDPELQFIATDLPVDFVVTPDHLVGLCDAVLEGEFDPVQLEHIASILVVTDQFVWNDANLPNDLVDTVIHAWESPDLNYELSKSTVAKFRILLSTGMFRFGDADRQDLEGGRQTR